MDAEYGPDAYGGSNYQFSVKPASSFAQIDETAPAFERYEQVAAELTSGQEKLTTSRAQLDTLRSAYDADPTEANATAYNRSLAQFQADLEAYNDLVDQYTYFNSLEGIQERVDELTPLVEAAEKERNEARTVRPAPAVRNRGPEGGVECKTGGGRGRLRAVQQSPERPGGRSITTRRTRRSGKAWTPARICPAFTTRQPCCRRTWTR